MSRRPRRLEGGPGRGRAPAARSTSTVGRAAATSARRRAHTASSAPPSARAASASATSAACSSAPPLAWPQRRAASAHPGARRRAPAECAGLCRGGAAARALPGRAVCRQARGPGAARWPAWDAPSLPWPPRRAASAPARACGPAGHAPGLRAFQAPPHGRAAWGRASSAAACERRGRGPGAPARAARPQRRLHRAEGQAHAGRHAEGALARRDARQLAARGRLGAARGRRRLCQGQHRRLRRAARAFSAAGCGSTGARTSMELA